MADKEKQNIGVGWMCVLDCESPDYKGSFMRVVYKTIIYINITKCLFYINALFKVSRSD